MHIVLATTLLTSRGEPAAFVAEQAIGLGRAGYKVSMVTSGPHANAAIRWIHLAHRLRHHLRWGAPVDVVHVHYGSLGGVAAVLAAGARNTVITLHGSDILGPAYSHRTHISSRPRLWMGRTASRVAASCATAIVAVSESVRSGLSRKRDRDRAFIIPCGVDFDRFYPIPRNEARRRLGLDERDALVLFASQARAVKNFALAEAAIKSAQAMANRQIRVLSADNTDHRDMPLLINAADLLLLTSFSEGSPVITKEALACNVPIVSTSVGDIAEQLKGVTGCAIVPGSEEPVARSIAAVLKADTRTDGRIKGHRYNNAAVCARLADVYTSLPPRVAKMSGHHAEA
jgi:teichuronic acid biosynthesis glycosyltransferase TuaC